MKKNVLLFLTFFSLIASVFAYRWIFAYRFDPTYFKDFYEHSQWSIALSPRTMGDAELYQYSGYKLVTGDDPFHINPEVPPLGKYAYGLAEIWLHNPYYASIFFYLATILLFWWLAKLLFQSSAKKEQSGTLDIHSKNIWLALFFFCSSPLLFSQIAQVGLEMPQLCFLLIHIIFLLLVVKNIEQKKHPNQLAIFCFLVVSGIGLGAFTATKIALFTPVILLADCWLLWKHKKLLLVLSILIATFFTYIAAFAPYFLHHHSLIDWLKSEKWVVVFYLSSRVQFIPFMILVSLCSGIFLTWWDGWTYIREWTVLWLVSTLIFFRYVLDPAFWQNVHPLFQHPFFQKIATRGKQFFSAEQFSPLAFSLTWSYLLLLCFGLVLANSIIPFWPRYLILVLPFLILFVVQFISQKTRWQQILIGVVLIEFLIFLFPQPNEAKGYIVSDWQSDSYAELYNFVDAKTATQTSRQNFVRTLQVVDHQLAVQQKKITLPDTWVWPWQNHFTRTAEVEYDTFNGNFHFTVPVTFTREQNQWHIAWNWSDVLPQFTPNSQIIVTIQPASLGLLQASDDIQLSAGAKWPFISVIPNDLKDSDTAIRLISEVTHQRALEMHAEFFVTAPADLSLPVSFAQEKYNADKMKTLANEPGVQIQQLFTRVYNPLIIQPDGKFLQIVGGIEKQHPELYGQNGIKIQVKDVQGNVTTVYQQEIKPGQQVTLPQSFQQLFGKGV